jgi:predicted nuclease of restriction endonuclease-like (RecB) superfamily
MKDIISDPLFGSICSLIEQAHQQVHRNINTILVQTYWEIGRLIVEDEQQGKTRATYGKQQLEQLSSRLTEVFGKGFDVTNLRNMRRFYQRFPIRETVSLELSWSHYNLLTRIDNSDARQWYLKESVNQNWSVRALERQISVLYYERLLSSKDQNPVIQEAEDNPTIGLILCSQKSEAVAKYSVLTDSEQLFAAKYMHYLPSEEELKRELERERAYVEHKIEEAKAEYSVS